MKSIQKLIVPTGIKFTSILHCNNNLQISCKSRSSKANCPRCNRISKRVHSYYDRKIRDLPLSGNSSILNLKAKKFYCLNPNCKQKIFTERIKEIPSYSRYTERSKTILTSLVIETSANKTAYLSDLLQLPVSPSTALRLVHSLTIDNHQTINTLGIDDWAIRKGVNYGTILIDMESCAVIDLLPGRDGTELKPFLLNHPEIKNVCRDRSSSYAAAVKEILPNAIQIADRFHLVRNVSEAIHEVIRSEYQSIKKILTKHQVKYHKTQIDADFEKVTKTIRPREEHYAELFYKVKELGNRGMGSKSIAKVLSISRNTVRKYGILEKPVKKLTNHQNNYNIFIDQIQQMLDNQSTIKNIYKVIKDQGYSGSYTSLCEYLQNNPMLVTTLANDKLVNNPPFLSARKISIYLGIKRFNRIRSAYERELFRTLLKKSPLLRKLRKIYLSFKNILSKGKPKDFEIWINAALALRFKHLNRLINGLKQDLDAVLNAIETNWSSGKVEGKINKLKTIKRQMYGRASLELLRRKVILSKTG